ncbi:MAG: cytochrome ubiquinol oxidase subunit I [Pseudomonadota bacterium]|nr:cytochrome ubiquinol oxidase subunit I [Pseudomonadota bacterium]
MMQSIPLFGYSGGMLFFFIIFIFSLNLMVGTSILSLLAEFRSRSAKDSDYQILAASITRSALPFISLGVVAALPLLFCSGSFFQPFYQQIFGSFNQLAGIAELLLGTTLLLFCLYIITGNNKKKKKAALHIIIGLAAAINALFLMFYCHLIPAFLLAPAADNFILGSTSIKDVIFNQAMLPFFVHAVIASLALAGLLTMLVTAYQKDFSRRQPREYYLKSFRFGGRWLLNATIFQIIPGLWVYFSLSPKLKDALLGGPLTGWFIASLVCLFIGLLLLLKMLKDNLVNSRAATIVAFLLLMAVILMEVTTTQLHQPHLFTATNQIQQTSSQNQNKIK